MDSVQELSQLKIQYENRKAKHEKWVQDNHEMINSVEYKDYIEKFNNWEKQMLAEIERLETSIKRRPIAQTPQLPTQNIDAQLHDLLENISKQKFTRALIDLCKKDTSVLNILTDIVSHETKGTGYYNSLLPGANMQGLPSITPVFPFMSQLPSVSQMPPMQASYASFNAPSTSTSIQTTPYTQLTPYGVIPADWKIDEPVKRKKQATPPPRQYTIKMPFNDFSQS
ncbi:hypothetical protein M3Y97_00711600 [Aphelenchoides bicaudatus]|nr:hypothetical protein M3Y97_00711600 [Aphelenchoides bicaudatus]